MSAAYSMEMALSPLPDVGEVVRQLSRDDEQRVDADVVAIARVARRKFLRGNSDASKAIFVERPCGCFSRPALLDLDEGNDAAATRDQVDFAARDTGTASENSPAFEPKPPSGDCLGPAASGFGLLSVQIRPSASFFHGAGIYLLAWHPEPLGNLGGRSGRREAGQRFVERSVDIGGRWAAGPWRRPDHNYDFPLGSRIGIAIGQLDQGSAHAFLVKLGEFPGDGNFAVAQRSRQGAQRITQARPAFVEDQRCP
jgi:hypothetical protein